MKFFDKNIGVFEVVLFLIILFVYNFIAYSIVSDIPQHVDFLLSYLKGNMPIPTNFLYYYTIYSISFFTANKSVLLLVAVYTLTIVTFWKYNIVKAILINEIKNTSRAIVIASFSSFLLIFCFSSPFILFFIDYYYLMSYTPNIWHNSTMIFAMPFVIMLFWQTVQQLENYSSKRNIFIVILIVLNILAKPSFLFVYVVAFPLMVIKKVGFSLSFFKYMIPVVIALLLGGVEYYFIYLAPQPDFLKSTIKIDFFHLMLIWLQTKNWGYLIFMFIITIISSFTFPIVLLIKNRLLLKSEKIQFALICVILGLIIGFTFYETGVREWDGNFMWQTLMASFILFFVSVIELLKLIVNQPNGWKTHRLEIIFFVMHFCSGVYYIVERLFIEGGYG